MFERMPLNQLLSKMSVDSGIEDSANQFNLFDQRWDTSESSPLMRALTI